MKFVQYQVVSDDFKGSVQGIVVIMRYDINPVVLWDSISTIWIILGVWIAAWQYVIAIKMKIG